MSSMPLPAPDDVTLLQRVQQEWNSGNQAAAIDTLRPAAEAGAPWAASLLAWLFAQMGAPGIEESVTWAVRAAQHGHAGQLVNTFNNLIGHLPSNPQFATRLPELLDAGIPWPSGNDLIGQGWNLSGQGHPELGLQLMMLPLPAEPALSALVDRAQQRLEELAGAVAVADRYVAEVDAAATQARELIEKSWTDVDTSARQAGLLVTTVTSDATNTLFKADAKRNAKESLGAWVAGLVVLGLAAVVAVLPVALHYMDIGLSYTPFEQIGLHLVSTAALATFAGVLLARARSRDQAAQRAHDLSTAMGTMISYSNQINDPAEKQRFMTMMGQVVLQAHLTSGGKQGGKDESLSGMIALANLIKPSNIPSAVSQTQG